MFADDDIFAPDKVDNDEIEDSDMDDQRVNLKRTYQEVQHTANKIARKDSSAQDYFAILNKPLISVALPANTDYPEVARLENKYRQRIIELQENKLREDTRNLKLQLKSQLITKLIESGKLTNAEANTYLADFS